MLQKTARDAAVKAHIAGKTVRDLVLDPVVTFTAETPKEKAHAFRYTVDALRVATDDQKKTVKHACEVIALNVAYVAQELRKDDGAPKVHRREVVERLKEVANALNLGVGAVNKDAALLVEWCTRAKTEGRTTDTAISANVWRQVQKLFTNKLNAHEARLKVGKDFVRAVERTLNPPRSRHPYHSPPPQRAALFSAYKMGKCGAGGFWTKMSQSERLPAANSENEQNGLN